MIIMQGAPLPLRELLATFAIIFLAAFSTAAGCADDRSAEVKDLFDRVTQFPAAKDVDSFRLDQFGEWGSALRAILYSTDASDVTVRNHYEGEFSRNGWRVDPAITMSREEVRRETDTIKEAALPHRTARLTLGPLVEHWEIPNGSSLSVLVALPQEPGPPIEAVAVVWLEGCVLPLEELRNFGIVPGQDCFIFVSSNVLSP